MSGLRLWHGMVIVIAAAFLLTIARIGSRGTPMAWVLLVLYICAGLGLVGAQLTGRHPAIGLFLGLLLGPIGVFVAWSSPVSEGWPESNRIS